jgi:hypothetical protein
LLAVIFLWLALAGSAGAQQIWFGPRSPNPVSTGSEDWNEMFQRAGAWAQLAPHVHVLMVTAGYIETVPDTELRAMEADLAAHHIGLAITLQSVAQVPGEACGHIEGYGPVEESRRTAARLAARGIQLQYARLDEPLWFGHYDDDAQGCQLPVDEVARRVALNVREYLKVFPKLTVGIVEPAPGVTERDDWATNFRSLRRALTADMGAPITFLHLDVSWPTPQWGRSVKMLSEFARAEGLQFGVIYNGVGNDTTNEAWVADARRHVDELETGEGVLPDQPVFQTWDAHPTRALPMESDSSVGGMVGYYLRPRTRFVIDRSSNALGGRLVEMASGRPVAGARITLETLGADPKQPPPLRTATGSVPAKARYAILAMRVNSECHCAGSNDLMVGDLTFTESDGITQRYSISAPPPRLPLAVKAAGTVRIDDLGGERVARLAVGPDQQFSFNSPVFAVTPGAQFTFTVPLGAVGDGGLFGTVAVIWQDADRHGLLRTIIRLTRDVAGVATTTTDADGRFVFPSQDGRGVGARHLRLEFDGGPGDRGAVFYSG